MILRVEDMSATYYAYDFKNPRRLERLIKIKKTGRVWTKIDDNELYIQESLFKTYKKERGDCL